MGKLSINPILGCAGLVGLSLFVAGCAQVPKPDPRPAWTLSSEDGETKLAWGRPDSEEVGLMLTCAPHSGSVTLSAPVEAGAARLTLASDRSISAYAGPAEVDPEAGVPLVSATAGVHDRTLSSFARTGRLAVVRSGGAIAIPASGGDRRAIRTFFDRCG